jgi:hypothetical protein
VSLETEPSPPPEVLVLGPPPRRRRPGLLVLVVVLAVALLAGLAAWRFWPRPVPPLTLAELQGVYAGMVRSDGTNDASLLERRNAPDDVVDVTPAACAPLFESTAFNHFPAEAIDGMSTYWLGGQDPIAMFTYRFADAAAAHRTFRRLADASATCVGSDVQVRARRTVTVRPESVPVNTDNGVDRQTAYSYRDGSSSRFAVHVLQFENTVSWQFRLERAERDYSPVPAQQLMDALMLQTRAVVELRT